MPIAAPVKLPTYTPALRAFLPLLYVGWADRSLSTGEVRLLRERVARLPWLTDQEKGTLYRLGDPHRIPTQQEFEGWAALIRETAATLGREDRESLATLGAAMARAGGGDTPFSSASGRDAASAKTQDASAEAADASAQTQRHAEAMEALRELEALLGNVDRRTIRAVFPQGETHDPTAAPPEALAQPEYTFDVAAMRRHLDDDYAELRDELRILLSTPAFAYPETTNKEAHREWTRRRLMDLAARGYGALAFPEAYGGRDDFGSYSAVFEMLGYHDGSLAIKFGVQFGLFGGSVASLGTERHHRAYLEAAGTGALQGCFAMTETGHGSNVRGLETTITYLPDTKEFEVHTPHWGAGKEYIGNALDATMASVFGQLIVDGQSQGVHAILVPLRNGEHELLPGVTVEDSGYKMGLNGVDNGRIWLERVRVPHTNLLNRFGDVSEDGTYSSPIDNPGRRFFTMLGTLVGGRVCVPRAGLSAAKAGLAIAVNYALRRRQFAPAPQLPETLLLDYPSHQRRLLPVLAKAYALDAALDWLNERYAARTDETMRELESQAAALKAYATWYTTETLQTCREACGGKAYLLENRIGQRKGDTEIYTTFEGDNTVLSYLVARSLLTKFRQSFNEDGAFGLLRFAAGRVTSQFTDLNPIAVRNTDPAHLRGRDFLETAFRFREERMVYSVAQRIRRKIKGGMTSGEAFVEIQTQLKDLANAYVERLVFTRFCESIKAHTDERLEGILKLMCALYGLHALERDKGWFFEYEFLTPQKSKAIRREVEALCAELRPHAAGLVDAFGIPREVLGARIV